MQKYTLPDIAGLSARLAEDNTRVNQYIDSIGGRLDKLVNAVVEHDWLEVRRISEYIARSASTYGCSPVSEAAMDVAVSASETNDLSHVKRRVIELLGTCGRMRQSIKAAS